MIKGDTKILITGCGGMLGEAVYHYFKDKCKVYATDIDVNEPWLTYLDVRDKKALREKVNEIKPDYIFHLASITDMEYCEQNPLEAYKTNTYGTENVSLLCLELNISLVYVSSAGVFDGRQERYTDYDIPSPINVYGKSVYAAERFIKEMIPKHFIFRAGWMIGGGPKKDKKFVNKIIRQIKKGEKEIPVGDDKFGTPTYTYDLARVIHEVIDMDHYGIYNAVCEGGASRFNIANEIVSIKNLEGVKIIKSEPGQFKKEYFAPRPHSEGLVNLKLKLKGIDPPRDIKTCMKDYMSRFDWGI